MKLVMTTTMGYVVEQIPVVCVPPVIGEDWDPQGSTLDQTTKTPKKGKVVVRARRMTISSLVM